MRMSQSTTVRACPLCGSKQITVMQADAEQAAAGVTCILKCECGAVVTLSVLQRGKNGAPVTKEKT
jgi:hypothetical protein